MSLSTIRTYLVTCPMGVPHALLASHLQGWRTVWRLSVPLSCGGVVPKTSSVSRHCIGSIEPVVTSAKTRVNHLSSSIHFPSFLTQRGEQDVFPFIVQESRGTGLQRLRSIGLISHSYTQGSQPSPGESRLQAKSTQEPTAQGAGAPDLLFSEGKLPNLDTGIPAHRDSHGALRQSPLDRLKLELEKEGSKDLWVEEIPRDEAAQQLGQFLGIQNLQPQEVLPLDAEAITGLLQASAENAHLREALFSHANGVTERFFGTEVSFRGIVEFSNVCQSDCSYCGIRKHQPGVWRYTMPEGEVVDAALWAWGHRYGTIMLQSGELNTRARMDYLTRVISAIRTKTVALDLERQKTGPDGSGTAGTETCSSAASHARAAAATTATPAATATATPATSATSATPTPTTAATDGVLRDSGFLGGGAALPELPSVAEARRLQLGICVALSVGELPREGYEELFAAGASRYLLRIETSNPRLFATLHPPKQTFESRLQCLRTVKEVGFQLGTGVMIGLPGQTLRDLADDLVFFREEGADMIGMGPYITEEGTPVAAMWRSALGYPDAASAAAHMRGMFELSTRLLAVARITTGNTNIAATTALQALHPLGREIALRRGANILMPILTPTKYREHYQLYEGKPCITDTADECRVCLSARVGMIGKHIRKGRWDDPPHFRHPIIAPRPSGSHPRGFHGLAFPGGGAASAAGGAGEGERREGHLWGGGAGQQRRGVAGKGAGGGGGGAGEGLPRTNIGFFGAMNAGKSSLMNLITMQQTSLVDETPGTTADTKVALMELHGVGPVKLLDTAGIDEGGALGGKKRQKVMAVLKECDLAVLVVDVQRYRPWLAQRGTLDLPPGALKWERELLDLARRRGREVVLCFNLRGTPAATAPADPPGSPPPALMAVADALGRALDPEGVMGRLAVDLGGGSLSARLAVTECVERLLKQRVGTVLPSVPPQYLARDAMVFLNIPMDAETPGGRLLRPQAQVQEEVLRAFGSTLAFRMDLAAARAHDATTVAAERQRFQSALGALLRHPGPKLLITDSQAIDIVHPWTLDPISGQPLVDITTFSIAMIQRQSGGRLAQFVKGLQAWKQLKPGDCVLVAEGCNHNRITELCNDIATVQIPQAVRDKTQGGAAVTLDHAFGREFPEDIDGEGLKQYKLAIHCGGCMLDRQKILARLVDLEEAGVPVTNFGVLLSYVANAMALSRVLKPWGCNHESTTP